jgi:hypothetical protein
VERKRTVTQVCHVKSRGAGASDPENVVGMCSTHHMEQHRIGTKAFEARHREALHGLTLKRLAQLIDGEYRATHPEGGQ